MIDEFLDKDECEFKGNKHEFILNPPEDISVILYLHLYYLCKTIIYILHH